jgi:hypothetical protein
MNNGALLLLRLLEVVFHGMLDANNNQKYSYSFMLGGGMTLLIHTTNITTTKELLSFLLKKIYNHKTTR